MLVLSCVGSCFSESNHNTPKRRNTRTDESTMEEIKEINNMMSANDWRDRYKGITTLLEMCEINSNLVAHNIVKVRTFVYFSSFRNKGPSGQGASASDFIGMHS